MRKSPILFLSLMATAISFGWGCGDDGGGSGGSGGQGEPCERDDDCETTECSFGFCISGFCQTQLASDGPAEGQEQVDGDCMSINCKAGELIDEFAGNDTAEDPNGADCMIPDCQDDGGVGMNIMVEDEVGENCDAGNGNGVCDAMGVCSCAILPGDGVTFVDPDNGQDIPTNGGAPGACAFATIEYALTQAPGEIRVPAVDFNIAGTLTLTGAQYLNCRFDDQNNTRTRHIGSGTAPVVAFNGMANGMEDCEIDAQGAASAVVISSVAMGVPHTIDDAIIGNAIDGVTIDGGNVDIDDNVIQNNTGVGLSFTPLDALGNFDRNNFVNNGTDVSCADESLSVTGEDNNVGSCVACGNCMMF